MNVRLTLLVTLVLSAGAAEFLSAADDDIAFFESRIRPVLVKHCYECHSSAAAKVQGGLRLDSRDGMRKGGESGAAIAVGKPEQSLLMQAIRYESFEMPPKRRLSAEVIADFSRWIANGAVDPRDKPPTALESAQANWKSQLVERRQWWSLQPPNDSAPPKVDDPTWSRSPVDRFIRAKLENDGLVAAPAASPEVLLRRLAFVLTGLPPTAKQVREFPQKFAQDEDQALENLVDRLLASPHYGERMARHWMDVVRYTDTYGYEWDIPAKGAWEYRDYLIRAFNDDVGFDQLIREQLAGDLLPKPRINEARGLNESLIGPMFYHLGEHRHGSSLAFNGIHQEMVNNKIDAFSKAFLGMTVACARCHDHKLDAISQADYYALAGMFMTPRWTARSIDAPNKNLRQIEELMRLRADVRQELARVWTADATDYASGESLQRWAAQHRGDLAPARPNEIAWPFKKLLIATEWTPPESLTVTTTDDAAKAAIDESQAVLISGKLPDKDTYTLRFRSGPGAFNQLRLQALTHDSLGQRGPGRTPHGNFVVTRLRIEVQPLRSTEATSPKSSKHSDVAVAVAHADYSQPNYPVQNALNPSPRSGWGVGLGGNVDRTAWFSFREPVKLSNGANWRVTIEQQYGSGHVLGRFRIGLGAESDVAPNKNRAADAKQVAASWRQMADSWRTLDSHKKSNEAGFHTLSDFANPGLPEGWIADGAGMEHGFVNNGEPRIELQGQRIVSQILPNGYHTHALSSKLAGAIRMPAPERFPRAKVSLLLRGGEWSGWRSVPQNAFLNEGPVFFDPQKESAWTTFGRAGLKNGVTRVLSEITTASLNSNFPPRTGVARAGKTTLADKDESLRRRSWFSITGIVAHDGTGVPAKDLAALSSLWAGPIPSNREQAWARMSAWLRGVVDRWAAGNLHAGDVEVLNWMLAKGLLANEMTRLPRASALVKRYRDVEAQIEYPRSANSMDERSVAAIDYRLNVRGDVDQEGPQIPRGYLQVLAQSQPIKISANASGRLELANALSQPESPQSARVFVNRVWQWVFGAGIVATPNDFGKLGDRPTHPELLDWLAIRFTEEGWSTKQLIKKLVLTQTFRQGGIPSERGRRLDPQNRLLHHYPTRRLEAEAIRDNLLAVSGRLDRKLFGPPINPPRVVEDAKKRLFSGPLDGNGRRSIYLELSIMAPPKFLVGFNLPDLKLPTGRRDISNAPNQALILLNDPMVHQLADSWASKLVNDQSESVCQRIEQMFLVGLGRQPQQAELARWEKAFHGFSEGRNRMNDKRAWAMLAHSLFNTKEFIYYR